MLFILITLGSAGLEVLVLEEEIFPLGKITTVPLNWKVRCPPGLFGLFYAIEPTEIKGVTLLGEIIDSHYPCYTMAEREDCV